MSEIGSIYLSASVPDKGHDGFDTIDTYFFRMAVVEFIDVVLGRREIVMGVHQIISPMMKFMANKYKLEFEKCVKLYQSEYEIKRFLDDGAYFENVTEVKMVASDEKANQLKLHERMFSENSFIAAVFIGGAEFLREEFELFKEFNPDATRMLIPSPGGVARELFENQSELPQEMKDSVDYIDWYCKILEIG